MKIFQLDENINHKKLIRTCNKEGKCRVAEYPNELKGALDNKMLPELLSKAAPLVTLDFTIAHDHKSYIPAANSGIIVIRTVPTTAERAARNLQKFKDAFPPWSEFDWSGVYVEINESEVYVCRLAPDFVGDGETVKFEIANFSGCLASAIAKFRRGEDLAAARSNSPPTVTLAEDIPPATGTTIEQSKKV